MTTMFAMPGAPRRKAAQPTKKAAPKAAASEPSDTGFEPSNFAPLILLFEKAAWTYVQAFVALLIVSSQVNVDVTQAAAVAALPAAFTIVMNGLPLEIVGVPFFIDLSYRIMRTFVASFLGLLLAMPVFHLDVNAIKAAGVGSLPTVFAFVKGQLAKSVGAATPATLPKSLDPAA